MKNKLIFFPAMIHHLKQTHHQLKYWQTKKRLYLEIPRLVDFLISYLNAGLHPLHALDLVARNVTFSAYLRFHVFKFSLLCTRGYSFVDAADCVVKDIKCMDLRRYLTMFFMGLKLSFLKGGGGVKILQKIRDKANDEIKFQKKLRVLTAQMRLQSYVILLSPLCLACIMLVISPEHILVFFESFFGYSLFFLMCVLNLCAVFLIKRITKISF